MIHLGDITKISGHTAPLVDCIIGGSPCQDLSVAGKRAGLAGKRSGLFMEQMRIVKEMRDESRRRGDKYIRPRYVVWENVVGAFSSNGGKDFQAVLTEIVRIVEPDAPDVPMPEKGRWPKAGCLYGVDRNWSLSFRVHDAQFWGVPQRRKRIALVVDFGGMSAPEILFERKGVSGHSEPRGEEGQGASAYAGRSVDTTGKGAIGFHLTQDPCSMGDKSLAVSCGSATGQCVTGVCAIGFDPSAKRDVGKEVYCELSRPLTNGTSPGYHYGVVLPTVANSLTRRYDGSPCADRGPNIVCCHKRDTDAPCGDQFASAIFSVDQGAGKSSCAIHEEVAPTLACTHDGAPAVCAGGYNWDGTQTAPTLTSRNAGGAQRMPDKENFNAVITPAVGVEYNDMLIAAVDCRNGVENPNVNGTLQAKGTGGTSLNLNNICREGYIVRRLTPLECERLQGFPDGWTDIGEWVDTKGKKRKPSDAPRYKALGNSIALPFWHWLIKRISAQYSRTPTLGSLFDGIGGFPLCWTRVNGVGSAVWSSEIEEFCIAVTKKHFGDGETEGDIRYYL